jgi:hypothetical protein
MGFERHNFYREVHKGIRALLGSLVEQAGRTDFQDAGEVADLRRATIEGFAILEEHARNETRFVAPLVRAHASGIGEDLADDHEDQARRMVGLVAQLQTVDPSSPSAAATGHAFAVGLSRFVGELLVHMADEEERALPALWAAVDDTALQRMHQELLASLSPDEKAANLAWMLPAMNASERLAMLGHVRATAPPEAFRFLSGLARRVLSTADWEQLERRLAPAA